jgi:UDP-2-acetamido-2-deoxy-ribo-hexuluronate aminotransferase
LLGLTPVLVDVLPDTFNIDPDAVEKAITPNTKAIVPVHLFGQVADMDRIMDIAQKHDLFVIEDNAQGIGATHTNTAGTKVKTGGIGHVGSTSFFPSKNLGCYGDGGAILPTTMIWHIPFAGLSIMGCTNGITTMWLA